MMGGQTAPATLFHGFDLEAHVPGDHLLRQVDRFLDMDRMRAQLVPFHSHLGRPSIDPELIRADAAGRIPDGHPLGAPAVRRGASEPRASLVLPARPRRPGA